MFIECVHMYMFWPFLNFHIYQIKCRWLTTNGRLSQWHKCIYYITLIYTLCFIKYKAFYSNLHRCYVLLSSQCSFRTSHSHMAHWYMYMMCWVIIYIQHAKNGLYNESLFILTTSYKHAHITRQYGTCVLDFHYILILYNYFSKFFLR